MGELGQLQRLQIGRNKLSELPAALCKLTQLRDLFLNNNQLTNLPAAMGELRQLRRLELANNQLRELPKGLRQCTALQELSLYGNPALGIPEEILGPAPNEFGPPETQSANPADILDYYFRRKRPLLEAKLILVGRGAVGKTSLVNRLLHNTFGKEKKTEGIKITAGMCHCRWRRTSAPKRMGFRRAGDHARDASILPHAAQPLPAGAERARR